MLKILNKQPYLVEIEDVELTICKDVFPTDIAYTSRFLGKAVLGYQPKIALDMGCGSGFLAIIMKKNGFPEVWASDHHSPATLCTKNNAKKNNLQLDKIILSDLFNEFPKIKFDLIVFNQAYAPNTQGEFFGCGADGGCEIVTRFLTQVKNYLNDDGAIIMPFSDMATPIHNPKLIAKSLGYKVKTLLKHVNSHQNHYIYEIKRKT